MEIILTSLIAELDGIESQLSVNKIQYSIEQYRNHLNAICNA